MTIRIQKISKDGLSKEEWNFTPFGLNLVYTSHFVYNRNNKREKWADERPECLDYSNWCERNGYDEYDEYYSVQAYKSYLNENNPILQKTKSGKSKLSGISAQIKDMPKCPKSIADKAYMKFCLQLKVIYE